VPAAAALAYAYGIVHRNAYPDWLLLRDPEHRGPWRLPGGEIPAGHTPSTAVHETARTETGLALPRPPELRAHQWTRTHHGPAVVYLFFLGHTDDLDNTSTTGPQLAWKHQLVIPHYLPRALSSLVIALLHHELLHGNAISYQETTA